MSINISLEYHKGLNLFYIISVWYIYTDIVHFFEGLNDQISNLSTTMAWKSWVGSFKPSKSGLVDKSNNFLFICVLKIAIDPKQFVGQHFVVDAVEYLHSGNKCWKGISGGHLVIFIFHILLVLSIHSLKKKKKKTCRLWFVLTQNMSKNLQNYKETNLSESKDNSISSNNTFEVSRVYSYNYIEYVIIKALLKVYTSLLCKKFCML